MTFGVFCRVLEVCDVALLRFLTRLGIEGHQEERCGGYVVEKNDVRVKGVKKTGLLWRSFAFSITLMLFGVF